MKGGTQIPQRAAHYPTLPDDIKERAQARGLDIEQSTSAFLKAIRTNRGMRRGLLNQMEALMNTRSNVQRIDDEYLAAGGPLTGREMDVLLGYADGDDTAAIAKDLGIGIETVKTHAVQLYGKLGARTRAHAIAIAYHSGILEPRKAA